jgi:hypothetical protein
VVRDDGCFGEAAATDVVRYVLPHLAAGCLAGAMAACGIVATNVGALRDLMLHTQGGWLAGVLLAGGFALTFGCAATGGAIMRIGSGED